MSQPVIEVKNIAKEYKIGHEQKAAPGTVTFRDALVGIAKKPIELITGHRLKKENFWALKDINFEVQEGDVLGIIGRNGSGKSTLLKIMSRIVEPTKGEIIMRGRVASLLEVGTGFHPELTGRENIYFNGAILGMKQKEIAAKFDEIVAFSEVEKFLDTPVKFYSSGMYVRLAFSVAAHLEPDILIVDEVLAVGDAAFQKKCLGKMKDVAGSGRTVLFVSHNIPMVQSLCTKTIFLDQGQIQYYGSTTTALDNYINKTVKKSSSFTSSQPKGDNYVKLLSGSVKNKQDKIQTNFDVIEPITIEFTIKVLDPVPLTGNVHIKNNEGEVLFVSSDQTSALGKDQIHSKGTYVKRCTIPANLLNCGTYYVGLSVSTMSPLAGHFYDEDVLAFTIVEDMQNANLSSRGNYSGEVPGQIRPVLNWESERKK